MQEYIRNFIFYCVYQMLKLDFVIDKKLLKGSHQLLKKVLLRFHWAISEIRSFEMYIFCHLMQPKDLLRLFDPQCAQVARLWTGAPV